MNRIFIGGTIIRPEEQHSSGKAGWLIGAELRGIGWWTSPDHPCGTQQALGNPTKEAAVVGLHWAARWGVGGGPLRQVCFCCSQ